MIESLIDVMVELGKTLLIVAVSIFLLYRLYMWLLTLKYGEMAKLHLALEQHEKLRREFKLSKNGRDRYVLNTLMNPVEHSDLVAWMDRLSGMMGLEKRIIDIRTRKRFGEYLIILGELKSREIKDKGLVANVEWEKIPKLQEYEIIKRFYIFPKIEFNTDVYHKFPLGINGSYDIENVVYHSLATDLIHIGCYAPTSAGKSTFYKMCIDGVANLLWPVQFVVIALTNASDYRIMQYDPVAWDSFDVNGIDTSIHDLNKYKLPNFHLITDVDDAVSVVDYLEQEKKAREALLDRFFPPDGQIYSLHENEYYRREFGDRKLHRIIVLIEDHTILDDLSNDGDKKIKHILEVAYRHLKDSRKVGIGYWFSGQEAQLEKLPIRRQIAGFVGAFTTPTQVDYILNMKVDGPQIRGAFLRKQLGGSGKVPFVVPDLQQLKVAQDLKANLLRSCEETVNDYEMLIAASSRRGRLRGQMFERIMAGQIKTLRRLERMEWIVT